MLVSCECCKFVEWMASKRTFDGENHHGNDDRDLQVRAKKRHGDPQEAILSFPTAVLESVLRKLMEETFPPMLQPYMCPRCRSCLNQQGGTSKGRAMQLCFVNRLPPTIFTQANLTAEDGGPLQIELRYAASQQRVVTEECSKMNIQICVLEGDFGSGDGNEDWTAEEFKAQIRKPREGKGPLLKGDMVVELENGVAFINNPIAITDSSGPTRNRMFRLGVTVHPRIREGRSEPFVVKDYRGESYKKHYPPSLNDELWRLEKIAKEGKTHKKLSLHGIHSVKDLLRLYITNESSLYEMFGNIPKKSWLAITEHAKTCVIDDYKLYSYHSEELQLVLLFNSIYILVGVTSDWQNYYSPDTLTPREKHLVEIVMQHAYKNVDNLKLIDDTKLNSLNLVACLKARQSDAPDQGQLGTWASTSASIFDEGTENALLVPDSDQLRALLGNGLVNSVPQVEPFGSDLNPDQWVRPNTFSLPYGGDGAASSNYSFSPNPAVYISSIGKSKTIWHKTRYVLKWVIPHVTKWKAVSIFSFIN